MLCGIFSVARLMPYRFYFFSSLGAGVLSFFLLMLPLVALMPVGGRPLRRFCAAQPGQSRWPDLECSQGNWLRGVGIL